MVPKQIGETCKPLVPSVRYCILVIRCRSSIAFGTVAGLITVAGLSTVAGSITVASTFTARPVSVPGTSRCSLACRSSTAVHPSDELFQRETLVTAPIGLCKPLLLASQPLAFDDAFLHGNPLLEGDLLVLILVIGSKDLTGST
jgi:hypothetical protein